MERYHHYQTIEDQIWCINCNIYPRNVLLGANVQSILIGCVKILEKLFSAQENQKVFQINKFIVFRAFTFTLCFQHSNCVQSIHVVASCYLLLLIYYSLSTQPLALSSKTNGSMFYIILVGVYIISISCQIVNRFFTFLYHVSYGIANRKIHKHLIKL